MEHSTAASAFCVDAHYSRARSEISSTIAARRTFECKTCGVRIAQNLDEVLDVQCSIRRSTVPKDSKRGLDNGHLMQFLWDAWFFFVVCLCVVCNCVCMWVWHNLPSLAWTIWLLVTTIKIERSAFSFYGFQASICILYLFLLLYLDVFEWMEKYGKMKIEFFIVAVFGAHSNCESERSHRKNVLLSCVQMGQNRLADYTHTIQAISNVKNSGIVQIQVCDVAKRLLVLPWWKIDRVASRIEKSCGFLYRTFRIRHQHSIAPCLWYHVANATSKRAWRAGAPRQIHGKWHLWATVQLLWKRCKYSMFVICLILDNMLHIAIVRSTAGVAHWMCCLLYF